MSSWGKRKDGQSYRKDKTKKFGKLGSTRAETGVTILKTKTWKPHRATKVIEQQFLNDTPVGERYYPTRSEPSFLLSNGEFGKTPYAMYHADMIETYRTRLAIQPSTEVLEISIIEEFLDKTGIIRVVAYDDGQSYGFHFGAPPTKQQLEAIRRLEKEGFNISYDFRFLPDRDIPIRDGDGYKNMIKDFRDLSDNYGLKVRSG